MAVQFLTHCLQGLSVLPVHLEVDISPGMPIFSIIGMAGTSVQEAKDRVRSAITHSGFTFPLTRKVVNLAPAELAKQGSHFDLPMALGFLIASRQMNPIPENVRIIGELGLDGSVRAVSGILPAVLFAKEQGASGGGAIEIVLPRGNLREASLVEGVKLVGVGSLKEVVAYFAGEEVGGRGGEGDDGGAEAGGFGDDGGGFVWEEMPRILDFADISGHTAAKRALLVAAAGGHHVIMNGPPGSGKSLLAEAFPGLLPPLSHEELLEVLRVYSVAGRTLEHLNLNRPFRRVHCRTTPYALLGGGNNLAPGEVSLAHRGVLFMDEFPEFDRGTLEALREPLEARELTLKYGNRSSSFPCQFQLIAARNPCPCGYFGDPQKPCTCSASAVSHYQNKISGPIVDRIDLHIEVPRLAYEDFKLSALENTKTLQERVLVARERQRARLKPWGLFTNQEMTAKLLKQEKLDLKTEDVLKNISNHASLSGRAIHRILKVSRTLADLDGTDRIEFPHLMEALQYRLKT